MKTPRPAHLIAFAAGALSSSLVWLLVPSPAKQPIIVQEVVVERADEPATGHARFMFDVVEEEPEPTTGAVTARPERTERVEVKPVEELEAKIEQWRDYAISLEAGQPQARAARLLGVTRADVQVRIDSSVLLAEDAHLGEALRAMKPKELDAAWTAETTYFRALGEKRRSCESKDPYNQRVHHDRVVVPFINAELDRLCNRFYELHVPAQRIESFRRRMLEDI